MAKKIKFPLDMANNAKARTIEELRENYDAEKLMSYYKNGMLLTWLEDRYYDIEAESIRKLDNNSENLVEQIAQILNIQSANIQDNHTLAEDQLKDSIEPNEDTKDSTISNGCPDENEVYEKITYVECSEQAPMPGKITQIVAHEGQHVEPGDVILILEAMQMQNEITASVEGILKEILVTKGKKVKKKEDLFILNVALKTKKKEKEYCVTAPVDGKITDIHVLTNEFVTKRDHLFTIETRRSIYDITIKGTIEDDVEIIIKEIYVTRGQVIKQGSPLFTIKTKLRNDPSEFSLEDKVYMPVSGMIFNIFMREGEPLVTNKPLLVYLISSLRNDIPSAYDGTIEKMMVTIGQDVKKGDELALITKSDLQLD